MNLDPNQPHWFARKPSAFRAFNLDAPKPCRWCGREASATLHYPPAVRTYERAHPEANTGSKR